jgi:hypothetical protein
MAPWLFTLAILSCPLGICLMLGIMMRGNKRRFTDREAELRRLEAEVGRLRAAGRDAPGQPRTE